MSEEQLGRVFNPDPVIKLASEGPSEKDLADLKAEKLALITGEPLRQQIASLRQELAKAQDQLAVSKKYIDEAYVRNKELSDRRIAAQNELAEVLDYARHTHQESAEPNRC